MTRDGQPPEQRNLLGSLQPPALPAALGPGVGGPAAAIQALLAPGRRLTAAEKNAARRAYWRKLRDRDAKRPDPAEAVSPFLSAALLPVSWADPRVWREASEPKGGRCAVCHPPPPALETTEVDTDGRR